MTSPCRVVLAGASVVGNAEGLRGRWAPGCGRESPSFSWGVCPIPHPPSPPPLCPVEPAHVPLAPGICVPERPGPPPAGFPHSGQLLPGPGPGKCDLFTLLEGSPAAAKNNCLHWPIGQQEVTSPSLAHLGCDTGHSHGCRPRWLVPPGEGSACALANFLPELEARASSEAPHRCGRPPAGVFQPRGRQPRLRQARCFPEGAPLLVAATHWDPALPGLTLLPASSFQEGVYLAGQAAGGPGGGRARRRAGQAAGGRTEAGPRHGRPWPSCCRPSLQPPPGKCRPLSAFTPPSCPACTPASAQLRSLALGRPGSGRGDAVDGENRSWARSGVGAEPVRAVVCRCGPKAGGRYVEAS